MPTRRELIYNVLSTPFAAALVAPPSEPASPRPEIIPEPHCLSEESANGFQLLLQRSQIAFNGSQPRLTIIPGVRQLSFKTGFALRRQASAGAWLILESGLGFMLPEQAVTQIRVLRNVFGFEVQAPFATNGAYIEYTWPLRRLVRDFSMFTPLDCPQTEAIAKFKGATVCAARAVGQGGVIFLGSMLGPGLLAEEREAHELGNAMLKKILEVGEITYRFF